MSNQEICTICHNKIDIEKSVYTNCDHRFCSKCFFNWMEKKPNCPNCRNKFVRLNEQAQEELDNTILAAQEWEGYVEQLKEDIFIMEERLNKVHAEVQDRESELIAAKTNLLLTRRESEMQQIRIRKQNLAWQERTRRRALYMQEWRDLHMRRSNFEMRF